MRLTEMGVKPSAKKINKVMESRFGVKIDYDNLNFPKAYVLAQGLTENLEKIKHSHGVHVAEKNPKYMELLMVREGLQKWINENRQLMESEMGKSGAILAAKDLVDSIQDKVEKVSKMQAEQLPALIDTIRDQIGMQDAEEFKNSVGQLLSGMADSLGQARESADLAARHLAGEDTGDQGMTMPADQEQSDLDAEDSVDAEMPDEFAGSDAAAGGTEPMGREQR